MGKFCRDARISLTAFLFVKILLLNKSEKETKFVEINRGHIFLFTGWPTLIMQLTSEIPTSSNISLTHYLQSAEQKLQ